MSSTRDANKAEVEFRVLIQLNDFKNIVNRFSEIAELKNQKKRFSIMVFTENSENVSILNLRTTVDTGNSNSRTEIVHKKGRPYASDRTEISKEVPTSEFEEYARLIGTVSSSKTLIMQRETVNLETTDGIVISVVKAKSHAYIEFEILCNINQKEKEQERLMQFITSFGMNPMDENESNALFKDLDEKDDRLISGTDEEIESVLKEYSVFIK